ncbi:MAG TPA: ABC transporter ATP-binding protein/permease [Candidatus Acidoferrales bacterium]|nr:ABC transporter ATP-binding protein/permease [Candidatus Acidoferrales bacterium]
MLSVSSRALFGRRFVRHLVRLTRVYWTSPDALKGGLLFALTVALELGTVYGNVLLSDAQRRIFDGFQSKQMAALSNAFGVFLGLALGFVLVSTYRIYVRQTLEIRWRQWLTDHYLKQWISSQAYWQIELHRKATDNPDQRIAEDVRNYVASALGLSLSLLNAFATLLSFAGILWRLSGDWAYDFRGSHVHIPGLMMWVAIIYAMITSWFTHRVGRRLVPIQFDRERFEADFRFTLVRFRENVESVALLHGEDGERRHALERFQHVVGNWLQLIRAQRDLILLTTSVGQANSLVPLLVAAPGYFAGSLSLGSVIQTTIAYAQVSGALVWFVNAYQEIAQWRASIERLFTFTEEIDSTCADLQRAEGIHVERQRDGALRLRHLCLTRPDGQVLVEDANAVIKLGDHVALLGPSGAGKRTLLRAIAGIWRFGRGRIELPEESRTMFVSERPYLPIGTLRTALAYPLPESAFSDQRIRDALQLLGLDALVNRLDETAHWEQQLSGSEQQRLALARVLLQEPPWIFLDGATSGLDEDTEKRVYTVLRERLPQSAIVSTADRSSVAQYHERRWTLVPHGTAMALQAA